MNKPSNPQVRALEELRSFLQRRKSTFEYTLPEPATIDGVRETVDLMLETYFESPLEDLDETQKVLADLMRGAFARMIRSGASFMDEFQRLAIHENFKRQVLQFHPGDLTNLKCFCL